MTAVESLLPTHARLARAAGESSTCIAKYIIIAGQDGEPAPILFPATITRRDALPAGSTPLSAGFLLVSPPDVVIPQIGSDSLRLEPQPRDRALIARFLGFPVPQNQNR